MPDIEEVVDEDDLPYSLKPSWKDVVPVPQDDGPEPLAVIRYPNGFEEAHSYFRAIQQQNEFSDRALRLTADVIEHNSANYTAWYYRRRCLKELNSDLDAELKFTNVWARDCPKNYQVWYHRRWLITEMAEQLGSGGDGYPSSTTSTSTAERIQQFGQDELDHHMDVMQVNDDYKNYNGWSHRQFIASKFNLWGGELSFCEDLLKDDIRNNSAWNHRFTVVRNTCWPLTDESRQREINFALKAIRSCANNESAWIFLAAFLGTGECKVPWDSVPEVEACAREVVAAAPDPQRVCRFAVEALARVHEARGELGDAIKQYELLGTTDKIRANYWDWRAKTAERTVKPA